MNALTPAAEAVIAKIVKLQNLAAKNDNEAEASAAMAMANKLLVEHNLDAATIERASGDTGKREKANVEGGFYQWQRELWQSVAELNFCHYWSQWVISDPEEHWRRDRFNGRVVKRMLRIRRRRHALIGRTVNVRATEVMARYLEAAIERVLAERFGDQDRKDRFITSFREGVAYRIRVRLDERRLTADAEDRKKARAAEDAAKRSGVSTSTAITLSAYRQSEEDANDNLRFGKERMDEWRADRAKEAAERRIEQDAYVKWAAANPEKAAAKEAAERKKREKAKYSRSNDRFGKVDDSAFWAGSDAGEKVGLDPQMDGGRASVRKITNRRKA